MTERSAIHATFVIERVYPASPKRVYRALSDPVVKRRWFHGPEEWGDGGHQMDFRVGGHESNRGGPKGGPVHSFAAIYQDIVPEQRIVYSYDMHLDATRISVSLATMELVPEGNGTRLVLTEQGVFLDGYDDAGSRERGTRGLLEALGVALEVEGAEV